MRKPGFLILGVVVALAGVLFTLQGYGAISGSTMSNSNFWRVAGPLVILVGLAVTRVGLRGRLR